MTVSKSIGLVNWSNDGRRRGVDRRMNETTISVPDLNGLQSGELLERLGHLYEHTPWIVRDALAQRPFASRLAFQDALSATVRNADPAAKLALIREHPDLVGDAALRGTLTRASVDEQTAAGLSADDLSDDEREMFRRLNATYRDTFGFPFVICARDNRKVSILDGFDARLRNDRETEIETALGEIEKIAAYRLFDIMTDE